MNPTDNLYYDWPLATVIIGGHEPQWVEDVLALVDSFDNDALSQMMDYMILVALEEVVRN